MADTVSPIAESILNLVVHKYLFLALRLPSIYTLQLKNKWQIVTNVKTKLFFKSEVIPRRLKA